MERRTFLALAAAGSAGCLGTGGSGGGGTPTAGSGTPTEIPDGYPPPPEETPEEREIDPAGFRTTTVEGVGVPLVPVDVAHYWHQRREARFADARGRRQFRNSRVLGAALSTAPDGIENDPVATWPADDRIVCYCGCPHHLSGMRAASLYEDGYERVYVIDEGFWEWHDRGYPMAGEEVTAQPRLRVVEGRTDPEHAGRMVVATHEPSGQREAAPVARDGSYELHLRFADVTAASVVTVETPTDTVRAPLGELAAGTVGE